MVVLNKIYTRRGDDGTTALGTSERVPKYALRVAAYGTVDETNAAIGLARSLMAGKHADLDAMLARIQNDLFDVGSDLCVPDRGTKPDYKPPVTDTQVKRLEDEIDTLNGALEPLRSFVLPGGEPGAAALHVARTVCRRAERVIAELAADPAEPVNGAALRYVNRLSDFLFVASRTVNDQGRGDVLWVPGQNR